MAPSYARAQTRSAQPSSEPTHLCVPAQMQRCVGLPCVGRPAAGDAFRRRAARDHRSFWTLEWVVRGYVGIHRAQKAIQVDGCLPHWMSLRRFPRLFPIRNPYELRGLYRRSYFGPRTCGGDITNVIEVGGVLNQGFPFSPLLREV